MARSPGPHGANVKHVDNGASTNTAWTAAVCFVLNAFLSNPETKAENEATVKTPDASTNNNEGKAAADDEIIAKEDAATSVSSSTRSSADTSDALLG